jgi:TIR domain
MPYPFFLSYAREDAIRIEKGKRQRDPVFEDFIDRLNQGVMQLTGEGTGFFDRHLEPGQEWPDEIAEALATAKTMICLYSPSFFKSGYCGKEMQVFLERRRIYIRTNPGKKPSNIIPVLWHPVPWRIPKTLPDLQHKDDEVAVSEGVWHLGGSKKTRGQLIEIADTLAKRVRDAADLTPLSSLAERPRMGAIPSAFNPPLPPFPYFDMAKSGPDTVTFVYSSLTDWSGLPWAPPNDDAALYLAAAVATGREMELTQLIFDPRDPNLVERLTALRHKNNVVVLFLDAATLPENDLCERIRDYDRLQFPSFSILIIITKDCSAEARAAIDNLFPPSSRRAAPYFQIVETKESFNSVLRENFCKVVFDVLEQIRMTAINKPHIQNVLGTDTKFINLPTVNGPGRFSG